MEEIKGCFNCAYSREYSTDQGWKLICVRYPPGLLVDGDGENVWTSWGFPHVWKYCWCGDWKVE